MKFDPESHPHHAKFLLEHGIYLRRASETPYDKEIPIALAPYSNIKTRGSLSYNKDLKDFGYTRLDESICSIDEYGKYIQDTLAQLGIKTTPKHGSYNRLLLQGEIPSTGVRIINQHPPI